jgi:hypothetical protein
LRKHNGGGGSEQLFGLSVGFNMSMRPRVAMRWTNHIFLINTNAFTSTEHFNQTTDFSLWRFMNANHFVTVTFSTVAMTNENLRRCVLVVPDAKHVMNARTFWCFLAGQIGLERERQDDISGRTALQSLWRSHSATPSALCSRGGENNRTLFDPVTGCHQKMV